MWRDPVSLGVRVWLLSSSRCRNVRRVDKVDLAGSTQVGVASDVARGLNDKASVMEVEFGRVDARELLGSVVGDEDRGGTRKEEKACCSNPECAGASRDHDHDHDHAGDGIKATSNTSAAHLGIASFVFQSTTPFNAQRLMALLNRWPIPIKDSLDFMAAETQEHKGDGETADEFIGVLRSKVCSVCNICAGILPIDPGCVLRLTKYCSCC